MADEAQTGATESVLEILSASAVRQAITECGDLFRKRGGPSANVAFDTSGGILKRMKAGEWPQVVASSLDSLEELGALGLLGGAPRIIGISRIALGVRNGETPPDISTVDAFTRTLRSASVVVRGDPAGGGTAGNHLQKIFEKLGLIDELAVRTVLRVGGYNVMKEVAEHRAPFGLTQSTEIVAVPGVEIGAWLPEDLQLTTHYAVAAGVAADASVQTFLDFVTSDACRPVFDKAGFSRP